MRTSLTLSLIAAIALGFAAPASADDSAAIRKVLDAQVKAISKHDGPGFAAGFAAKPFAMMPGGYARTTRYVGEATRAWWGADPSRQVSKAKVAQAVIGQAGEVAWLTADIVFSEVDADNKKIDDETYRATELLVRTKGAWKVQATYWSIAFPNDDALWANTMYDDDGDGGDGGDATATAPGAAWVAKPAELAKHLRAGKDVVVLGSAAKERGAGADGAKLLGGWKRIAFKNDWLNAGGDGTTYAWLAGRISRPSKANGEMIAIPYWTLVLLVKSASGWEVVSAHYGQTMPTAGLESTEVE